MLLLVATLTMVLDLDPDTEQKCTPSPKSNPTCEITKGFFSGYESTNCSVLSYILKWWLRLNQSEARTTLDYHVTCAQLSLMHSLILVFICNLRCRTSLTVHMLRDQLILE